MKAKAFALPESMTEANKILAVQQDFISFCTDVGPAGGSDIATHPRAYGSFPRILGRYVRELGVISLERAVAQASAAAANAVFAYDRGRIAVGSAADVIVFDPQRNRRPRDVRRAARDFGRHEKSLRQRRAGAGRRQIHRRPPGPRDPRAGLPRDKAPYVVATGKLDDSFKELDAIDPLVHGTQSDSRGWRRGDRSRPAGACPRLWLRRYRARKKQVEPTSMFRIASISKPITAVAIMQLVEQGKLKLDDRVLDILKYEPHRRRMRKSTSVGRISRSSNCLQHRGGWDRDVSFDGMFQSVHFARTLRMCRRPPSRRT